MASVNLDIAQQLDITCRKGDTFKLTMNITDSSNQAVDVTQYSFRMEVKSSATAEPIITFSNTDFDKSSDGTLVIKKAAADMQFASGAYLYDIEATKSSDSTVQTWITGTLVLNPDITD